MGQAEKVTVLTTLADSFIPEFKAKCLQLIQSKACEAFVSGDLSPLQIACVMIPAGRDRLSIKVMTSHYSPNSKGLCKNAHFTYFNRALIP